MIVHLTNDLLSGSSLPAVAKELNLDFRRVSSVPELTGLLLPGNAIKLIIIDLQSGGLDVADLGRKLAESPECPEVLAYAQHVHEDLLELARESGIRRVLTRGQLFRSTRDLLNEYLS